MGRLPVLLSVCNWMFDTMSVPLLPHILWCWQSEAQSGPGSTGIIHATSVKWTRMGGNPKQLGGFALLNNSQCHFCIVSLFFFFLFRCLSRLIPGQWHAVGAPTVQHHGGSEPELRRQQLAVAVPRQQRVITSKVPATQGYNLTPCVAFLH